MTDFDAENPDLVFIARAPEGTEHPEAYLSGQEQAFAEAGDGLRLLIRGLVEQGVATVPLTVLQSLAETFFQFASASHFGHRLAAGEDEAVVKDEVDEVNAKVKAIRAGIRLDDIPDAKELVAELEALLGGQA